MTKENIVIDFEEYLKNEFKIECPEYSKHDFADWFYELESVALVEYSNNYAKSIAKYAQKIDTEKELNFI